MHKILLQGKNTNVMIQWQLNLIPFHGLMMASVL